MNAAAVPGDQSPIARPISEAEGVEMETRRAGKRRDPVGFVFKRDDRADGAFGERMAGGVQADEGSRGGGGFIVWRPGRACAES